MIEKAIEKANILIEALPYIRQFHGKTMVIKYGGSTIADRGIEKNFIVDVVLMKFVGINPIIVHGGGPFITEALREADKETRFVHGLRITDKESIEIVGKVLAKVNETIISLVEEAGGKAKGLKNIVKAKRYPFIEEEGEEIDIGFVGEVEGINGKLLMSLLKKKEIPVVNPLGIGKGREALNVNADEAAARIAIETKAEKFFILTDVPGIMRDWADKESLISTLTAEEAESLIEEGVVMSGMIPKVKSCIKSLRGGVGKVHIVDGRLSHSLLLEIFTDKGIGTQMVKE